MNKSAILKLSRVTKKYVTGKVMTTALHGIDLIIETGEYVSISGPSGSGKSTLMDVMGLLTSADDGSVSIDQIECTKASQRRLQDVRRGRIGYIFQSYNLIDRLSVFENVELPLVYQGVSGNVRRVKVNEMLERLALSHRADHFPGQLSGGQQQRVAIARAFVYRPSIILADEPTGNLDSAHGDEVMDILEDLNDEGATVVMVTHSPLHAARAARRLNMLDGRINSDISLTRSAGVAVSTVI